LSGREISLNSNVGQQVLIGHIASTGEIMASTDKSYLIIVNDGPYGSEKPYNALRVALNLSKRDGIQVRVFLIGDGVQCVLRGQETHKGYYNIERMMTSVARSGEVAT
jgi:hypothetical protein